MNRKKITLNVGVNNIGNASRSSSRKCPICLALIGMGYITVDTSQAQVMFEDRSTTCLAHQTDSMIDFLRGFDAGWPVEPAVFELDVIFVEFGNNDMS